MKSITKVYLRVFLIVLIVITLSHGFLAAHAVFHNQIGSKAVKLIAVIPRHFPPQYFLDEKGNPTGFAIDMIEEIAKQNHFKITYQIKNSWEEVQETLQKGEADLIPNMGITETRQEIFLFTSPLETIPISVFFRRDDPYFKSIIGRKVGLVKSNIAIEILQGNSQVDLKLFDDVNNALFELLAGRIDAVVYPKQAFLKVAREIGVEDRLNTLDQPLVEVKRAIAVNKNNLALQQQLDQAIEEFIKSPKYQEIYIKWYGRSEAFWTLAKVIKLGLILLGSLLITIAVWRYISQQAFRRLNEAKKALEESENRYRAIIEDQTELICRFLPNGTITFVNQAYCRYFNHTSEQLIGQVFLPLISPEDQEKTIKNLANLNAENQIVAHEHRVIDPQGNIRWHQWTNRAILDSQGQIIEIQGVGRDITLLKQAEVEITELNRELENRVKQRTIELEIANQNLQEAKEKYQSILATALDAFCIVKTQEKPGYFVDMNQSFCQMIGYSREELLQMSIHDIEAEENPEDTLKHIKIIMTQGFDHFETRHRRKDKSIVDVEVSVNYIPSLDIMVSFMRDITLRKLAEKRLCESENRFRKAVMDAPFPIIIHAENGEIITINTTWTDLTGYTLEEIPTIFEWVEKAYSKDAKMVHSIISQLYQTTGRTEQGEFKITTKHKETRIWNFSSSHLGQLPDGRQIVISMAIDLTERKRIEEELRHKTLHDSLTKLPNRVLFMELVEQALKRSKRHENYLFAVLFIDLDRFKVVNDSLGHWAGDQLLIDIASRLEQCVRESDTVARLGGDEFTMLLDDIQDYQQAIKIAERINENLQLPFLINHQEIFATASIGIVFNQPEYSHSLDILRNADLAMYWAKDKGKARYAIFDQEMRVQINRFLELETNLRLGLERKEFKVYYQPIINLNTGKLYGFESLVRWQHPQHGLISPAEFIPIAEETGLIIPLGEWILLESCQQLRAWQEKFTIAKNLKISVNLSGKQLQNMNIIDTIDRVLNETKIGYHCLKVEITESMLMENLDLAYQILTKIKERNIQISIDDFGTGYSSLSYLHQFPINTIKIDQSFVSRIGDNGNNIEVVQAIITLAKNLNLEVIAEGIETEKQIKYLQYMGCKLGQGYLFSKPLPSQEVEKFIVF
jgi:diguanylate cyclase (GGDEF)-like protein/PAS domain S-box-containing protein